MIRAISIFWIAVSVLMIVVAYSGLAETVLQAHASCGADGETARSCNPGEIAHVLGIVGWISLAVGFLELKLLPKLNLEWS